VIITPLDIKKAEDKINKKENPTYRFALHFFF
jgi:hypothetical protein